MSHDHLHPTGLKGVLSELKAHAPFTVSGALLGIAIMAIMLLAPVPETVFSPLFTGAHSLHIILSAIVTTGLFLKYNGRFLPAAIIGLFGAIGIATLSDILFPHHGAALILRVTGESGMHMHFHIAVIDHWYIILPSALLGVAAAGILRNTEISHAGHVLVSTWASLFYVLSHSSPGIDWIPRLPLVFIVLFISVWVPCCVSDIVFPMLLVKKKKKEDGKNGDD